ncbi:hypothetical protein ACIPY0_20465 [Paenarthrobacter nicotinovorans]|uniref:hypothetical protein n=1 Tax=Paenarthrobacter nicotinovorans TaxID=29320 RepID=UPI00381CF956
MSNPIAALLQPIKARLEAATPGPWEAIHRPERSPENDPDILAKQRREMGGEAGSSVWVEDEAIWGSLWPSRNGRANATLIAAAPTDQAKLIAAVEAVVALHEPGGGYFTSDVACQYCSNSIGYVLYPCSTVAALTQALGGDAA